MLRPGDLHVWQAPLDLPTEGVFGSLQAHLSSEEAERAHRFLRVADREQFLGEVGVFGRSSDAIYVGAQGAGGTGERAGRQAGAGPRTGRAAAPFQPVSFRHDGPGRRDADNEMWVSMWRSCAPFQMPCTSPNPILLHRRQKQSGNRRAGPGRKCSCDTGLAKKLISRPVEAACRWGSIASRSVANRDGRLR